MMEILEETLLRWSVDVASSEEVVHDAAMAVGAGVSAPWVLALACLPAGASAQEIEDTLQMEPPDLPVPLIPRRNPEVLLVSALAAVRQCADGHLSERSLTAWAHQTIGHGQSEELERLVSLDDAYDIAAYTGESVASVDRQVRAEMERLMRRHPRHRT